MLYLFVILTEDSCFLDLNLTKDLLCSIIGFLLLALGLISVVSYFSKTRLDSLLRNELKDGLIVLTVGLLLLIRKDFFIEIIYLILAVFIVVSGYKML